MRRNTPGGKDLVGIAAIGFWLGIGFAVILMLQGASANQTFLAGFAITAILLAFSA